MNINKGNVTISNNILINNISLNYLSSLLNVLPQEPIIFTEK